MQLAGWINKIRNLGGMVFIDLRDRYGIIQLTIDPSKNTFQLPELKPEYVIRITGTVIPRPDSMINTEMATGEIEVEPIELEVLSTCKELPFSIDHENPVGEDLRLEYRYLDLRRKSMKENLPRINELF